MLGSRNTNVGGLPKEYGRAMTRDPERDERDLLEVLHQALHGFDVDERLWCTACEWIAARCTCSTYQWMNVKECVKIMADR